MSRPSDSLDRAASALARALLAWATGRLEPSRRCWLEALNAELGAIEGGGRQLAWAMGGLWLVWLEWRRVMRQEDGFWSIAWNSAPSGMVLGVLLMIVILTSLGVSDAAFPFGLLISGIFLYLGVVGLLVGRRIGSMASGALAGATTATLAGCFVLLAFDLAGQVKPELLPSVVFLVRGAVFGAGIGAVGALVGIQVQRVRR